MPLILPVLVYATEGWAIVSVLTFIAGVVVTGLITDSDGLSLCLSKQEDCLPMLQGRGSCLGTDRHASADRSGATHLRLSIKHCCAGP